MSEVRQCALDSTMPPGPVISGHLDNQFFDLRRRAGPPGPAFPAPVVSLRNQPSVPTQQRFRRDDRRYLGQKLSPESFGFGCEPSSLTIGEPKATLAELLAKYAVLFAQIFNYLELPLIHPTGNRDQQETEMDRELSPCCRFIIHAPNTRTQPRIFNGFRFSGHTGSGTLIGLARAHRGLRVLRTNFHRRPRASLRDSYRYS